MSSSDLPPGVDLTISPADGMYLRHLGDEVALGHYLESGRTALRAVRLALAAASTPYVSRILDLPCGHGRILRVLAAAFPDARVTACDLDRDGVDFCAATFGAEPVYSQEDLAQVRLPGPFDLIWCGSLLTHLPADRWPAVLGLFRSVLAPRGVCVMTVHGNGAAAYVRTGHNTHNVADPAGFLRAFDRTGYAFARYASDGRYGTTLTSPAWVAGQVAKLPGVSLALYLEQGWHNHQDVVAWGWRPPAPWEADRAAT